MNLSSVEEFPRFDDNDGATSWAQHGGYDYYFVQLAVVSESRPGSFHARVRVLHLLPVESEPEG